MSNLASAGSQMTGAANSGSNGNLYQNGGLFGAVDEAYQTNVYGPNQNAGAYNAGAIAQGQSLYGQSAPQINTAGGDAYNSALMAGISNAQNAAAQAQQTALGKGAQIDASNLAVQAQANQQLGQNLNASMALAGSARGGGPGLAAAQGGAQQQLGQQSTASAASAASAAAAARANLMAQANQQYGALSLGAGQLGAQGQQQAWQLAGSQADLQAGQNGLSQAGLISSEQLGQNAQLAQLQANENALANQYGLAGTSGAAQTQAAGAGAAAAGTVLAGAARYGGAAAAAA